MLGLKHRGASLVGLFILLAAAGAIHAQHYPSRSVRIIVPFSAGGPTDILARLLAQRLTESMGQQFIVDNRAGGGGTIGAQAAARSAPDGYTLYIGGITSLAMAPHTHSKLPYDPFKDFVPITKLTQQPVMLMVHPVLPARSVKEFVALAKAKPGALDYASSGIGGSGHLAGELFKSVAGINMVHVPYKSAAPALTDLVAGQVQVMFGTLLASVPHIRNEKVRGVALTGPRRVEALPQVPTFLESGISNFDASSWNCMMAPAGTPQPVVARLNSELVRIVRDPAVLQRLKGDGVTGTGSTPQELAEYLESESAKWGKVARDVGIKVN
ncbi:MAG: tripartite tricarboxylate transporter substrate binding protein [Betaproteobacteria bacterium]|nr:tripartite tricarboxylate transporter substrate binding protein [Betaproteobacteria bacterium]